MSETDLFELLGRYWQSGSIFVASKLGLFHLLAHRSMNANEASKAIGIDVEAARAILNILVSTGVAVRDGSLYELKKPADDFIKRHNGSSVINHYMRGWQNWGNGAEILRHHDEHSPMTDKELDDYVMKMDRVASYIAPHVVDNLDLRGATKLLDLGGGSARYSILLARQIEELKIELLDRKRVVRIAANRILHEGLQNRISTIAGDLLKFQTKEKYDSVLMANLLHLFPPQKIKSILDRISKVLTINGQVIIVDYMLPRKTKPTLDFLLFSLHMMLHTKGGRCYSQNEIKKMCESSGLTVHSTRRISKCGLTSIDRRFPTLIVARRSGIKDCQLAS